MPHCFLPPPPSSPHPPKKLLNESTIRLKKRTSMDSCICRLKSTSPVGVRSWRRQAEPGTASTHRWGRLAGASLGARWPRCQQAGPGLIKDVEPNWSCQHLLRLHMGGWRRCSAQHRMRVTLRRDWGATYQKKKRGGGGQMETKEIGRLFNDGVKWTAHIPSINIAVGPLSTSHHCCHLSSPTASRVA